TSGRSVGMRWGGGSFGRGIGGSWAGVALCAGSSFPLSGSARTYHRSPPHTRRTGLAPEGGAMWSAAKTREPTAVTTRQPQARMGFRVPERGDRRRRAMRNACAFRHEKSRGETGADRELSSKRHRRAREARVKRPIFVRGVLAKGSYAWAGSRGGPRFKRGVGRRLQLFPRPLTRPDGCAARRRAGIRLESGREAANELGRGVVREGDASGWPGNRLDQ